MSGLERKIKRNQIKQALKNGKQKRTMPISQYRMKTQEEMEKEAVERMTEQMIQTAKKHI